MAGGFVSVNTSSATPTRPEVLAKNLKGKLFRAQTEYFVLGKKDARTCTSMHDDPLSKQQS